jgi:hypothetical protein
MLQVNDIVKVKGEEGQFFVVEIWPGTAQVTCLSVEDKSLTVLPRRLLEMIPRA